MSDAGLYRPGVGIALFNQAGLVFVGERIDTPGAWQMPQGGIDADETPEQAAFRELSEEIGCNKAEILKIADQALHYDLPKELAQRLWGGRFIGQAQTWIAMRFIGQDEEINLNAFSAPEFSAWQWVSPHQTLDLIVPFKRDIYTQVLNMFSEYGPS